MSSSGRTQRVLAELTAVAGGEFEVLREIGRGGMGWVFLARDLRLNRRVALKVLSPSLLMEDDMGDRFLREAQILASLRHAHIVAVHAVHHVGDVHWFVMDFIDGPSLDHVLGVREALPIRAIRTIAYMVGSALDYGHHRGRGVVHRDIKPGNVILDAEGAVVVTDFGISKVLTGATRLTRTGLVMGTPEYMSPEQCGGDEDIGPASDQYSFGVLLYHMITGRPPFKGGTVEVLLGHVQKTPAPIRERRPDCPPEMAEAVERMLLKSPAERFPDIVSALEAMGARPVGLRSPERAELADLARGPSSRTGAIDISSPLSPLRGVEPPEIVEDAGSDGEGRTGEGAAAGAGSLDGPGVTPSDEPVVDGPEFVASLFVGSPRDRIQPGDSIPIWVDARNAEGRTMPEAPIQLTVDRPDVASLDDGGLLVAHRSGTVTVTATTGEIERHVMVEIVEPRRAARIALDPPELKLAVGASRRVQATVYDQFGEPLEAEVVWSVDPPGPVRMDGPMVVAIGEGETRVTATAGLASASIAVGTRRRPAAIVLDGARETAEPETDFLLKPIVVDADGIPVDGVTVRWTSSKPEVAIVDVGGRVRTREPGITKIAAAHGTLRTQFELEVVAPKSEVGPKPVLEPPVVAPPEPEAEGEPALPQPVPGPVPEDRSGRESGPVNVATPEDAPEEASSGGATPEAETPDAAKPFVPSPSSPSRSAPAVGVGEATSAPRGVITARHPEKRSGGLRWPMVAGVVAVAAVGGWFVFGRGGGGGLGAGDATDPGGAPPIDAAESAPATPALPERFAILPVPALAVGDSAQATSDLPAPWADRAQWASSDPTVAAVSAAGMVRAVGSGTASLVLRLEGREVTRSVQVRPATTVAADSEDPPAARAGAGQAAGAASTGQAERTAPPPTRASRDTQAAAAAAAARDSVARAAAARDSATAAARRDAQPAEPVGTPTRQAPVTAPPPATDLPPGEIRIRVRPEATTYVNDEARPDALRSTNILSLPPGEYRIRLARPGFLPFDTTVVVVSEGTIDIRKNLQPGGDR